MCCKKYKDVKTVYMVGGQHILRRVQQQRCDKCEM